LPVELDYTRVGGLSNEVREKLIAVRPATLGQAARIEGVTPGVQLVTDGFDKLQNGSKVVQRKPGPTPAPSAAPGPARAEGSAATKSTG